MKAVKEASQYTGASLTALRENDHLTFTFYCKLEFLHMHTSILAYLNLFVHLNQTLSGWGLALMGKCLSRGTLDKNGQYQRH